MDVKVIPVYFLTNADDTGMCEFCRLGRLCEWLQCLNTKKLEMFLCLWWKLCELTVTDSDWLERLCS